ncbi:4962_t:CDS:2, partial [Dentiscutata heterogama]
IDDNSFKVKKRKKNQDLESFSDLNINIPGFVGNISSRKLITFITAGSSLYQLLEALNNNWVLLDIINDISIIWKREKNLQTSLPISNNTFNNILNNQINIVNIEDIEKNIEQNLENEELEKNELDKKNESEEDKLEENDL